MEIGETKLKDILKKQREEYQTHIGALAEEFQSKLSAGLEPIVSLIRTTNTLVEAVTKMQKQIANLQEIVAQTSEDVTIMKSDVQFIKQELKQKVSVEEFGVLEKRVLLLERKAAH